MPWGGAVTDAEKEGFHEDILVQVFPLEPGPAGADLETRELLGLGVEEAWEISQGDVQNPAVGQGKRRTSNSQNGKLRLLGSQRGAGVSPRAGGQGVVGGLDGRDRGRHWRSALLEIEFEPQPNGSEGFVHRIRSPEGHREIVSPPDELYTITFNLYDLFLGAGRPWKRVKYLVTATEGTDWDYRVAFEY